MDGRMIVKKKYILYGAGRQGMEALRKYGAERVAYFCDGFSDKQEIEGISVIKPDSLEQVLQENPNYTVVITPMVERVQNEIIKGLEARNISYLIFEKTDGKSYGSKTFKIQGIAPNIEYIIDEDEIWGFEFRVQPTVDMFQCMFEKYADVFAGKKIDITVYIGDFVLDGYENRAISNTGYVFAYSTLYALRDVMIPIPDYRTCFAQDKYAFAETPQKCAQAAAEAWADKRIGWRGSVSTSDGRKWLQILAANNQDVIYLDDPSLAKDKTYTPMWELGQFKYTLDIRGFGWTDRVKILLQLGRPMFLVERPFKEWYFDKLMPMRDYVPVKEDLSDLLEKYEYLESHPEVYAEIVASMKEFVGEYFSPDYILEYLKDVVLKYGVV